MHHTSTSVTVFLTNAQSRVHVRMVLVVFANGDDLWTSDAFYPSHGHHGLSTTSRHCGLPPSNLYSNNTNVHLNCKIPDQSVALGNEWPHLLDSGNIGIGQKLAKINGRPEVGDFCYKI